MGKLSLGLGLGVGYVLGAQAGRGRYEQIRRAAKDFMGRPEVQQALEQARTAAPAPLQGAIGKLAGGGSGGQGAGSQPTGAHDVGAPTPPAPGGAARTDDPLTDPLIPPSRST